MARRARTDKDALDWSATIDDLIELHGYTTEEYATPAASIFASVTKPEVKALVSIPDSLILVASNMSLPRVPFAKAHELGHAVIPWHKDLLYACDEHDLSQATRKQMEFEANTFASEVLLPKDLLQPFYARPSTLETVLDIRKHSGASIQSSAQAYVKYHPGVCVLLTLESPGGTKLLLTESLTLARKTFSESAWKTILGKLVTGQSFKHGHSLHTAAVNSSSSPASSIIRVDTQVFQASVLNNSYKVIVLLSELSE